MENEREMFGLNNRVDEVERVQKLMRTVINDLGTKIDGYTADAGMDKTDYEHELDALDIQDQVAEPPLYQKPGFYGVGKPDIDLGPAAQPKSHLFFPELGEGLDDLHNMLEGILKQARGDHGDVEENAAIADRIEVYYDDEQQRYQVQIGFDFGEAEQLNICQFRITALEAAADWAREMKLPIVDRSFVEC